MNKPGFIRGRRRRNVRPEEPRRGGVTYSLPVVGYYKKVDRGGGGVSAGAILPSCRPQHADRRIDARDQSIRPGRRGCGAAQATRNTERSPSKA